MLTSVTFFIASYKFSGGNHHILFYHFFSNLLDYSIKTLNVESKARPSTATCPWESCLLTASENSSSIAALLGDLMTYNGRVLSGALLFLPIIMNTKSLSLLWDFYIGIIGSSNKKKLACDSLLFHGSREAETGEWLWLQYQSGL